MNLRDLEYLVAVADLRNFTQAAEQCHISQPTLSFQIKKLEEFLGVVIYERDNKHVILTPVGEQILNKVRIILREVQDLKVLAQNAKDPFAGQLRMGAFPTIASYIFPKIIPAIHTALPQLKLILREEKTSILLEKLKEGEIDVAFLALPIPEHQLLSQALFEDEFLLAVPAMHPLAQLKRVDQKLLAPYKLLLLEEGHCLRDQALAVCQTLKTEEQDFRATSLETLRQMVKANTGITLIPKIAVSEQDQDIKYLPFTMHVPKRTVALVWRKTSARSLVITQLLSILREVDYIKQHRV